MALNGDCDDNAAILYCVWQYLETFPSLRCSIKRIPRSLVADKPDLKAKKH